MNTIPTNANAQLALGECGKANNSRSEFCSEASTPVKLPVIRSPREIRLLQALLDGSKSRETLDRVVGCSNTPDIVLRLRGKGFSIPCEMLPATDRDGRPCQFGQYKLTDADRGLAVAICGGGHE